jgi:3',5'-cyclic-AMP phosphodiesterase
VTPFLLAQLSDLHIKAHGSPLLGRIDTAGMLRACVQSVLALKQQPDAVVITGDLTELGSPEEYAFLRGLLAPLVMPLYLIPGNHDERGALRKAFPDHAYLTQSQQFIQYVIDSHPLRIVALDTVIPGASGGELCRERLAWLERTLAGARDRPTVVMMHHPPFRTFIEGMDAMALRDPQPFADVIQRNPQVEAILCGHVHRPITVRFAGTVASIAPSTAHHIALDLGRAAPLRYAMEPPAYRVHAYSAGAALVTHTVYVGNFSGPQRFDQPGEGRVTGH